MDYLGAVSYSFGKKVSNLKNGVYLVERLENGANVHIIHRAHDITGSAWPVMFFRLDKPAPIHPLKGYVHVYCAFSPLNV